MSNLIGLSKIMAYDKTSCNCRHAAFNQKKYIKHTNEHNMIYINIVTLWKIQSGFECVLAMLGSCNGCEMIP